MADQHLTSRTVTGTPSLVVFAGGEAANARQSKGLQDRTKQLQQCTTNLKAGSAGSGVLTQEPSMGWRQENNELQQRIAAMEAQLREAKVALAAAGLAAMAGSSGSTDEPLQSRPQGGSSLFPQGQSQPQQWVPPTITPAGSGELEGPDDYDDDSTTTTPPAPHCPFGTQRQASEAPLPEPADETSVLRHAVLRRSQSLPRTLHTLQNTLAPQHNYHPCSPTNGSTSSHRETDDGSTNDGYFGRHWDGMSRDGSLTHQAGPLTVNMSRRISLGSGCVLPPAQPLPLPVQTGPLSAGMLLRPKLLATKTTSNLSRRNSFSAPSAGSVTSQRLEAPLPSSNALLQRLSSNAAVAAPAGMGGAPSPFACADMPALPPVVPKGGFKLGKALKKLFGMKGSDKAGLPPAATTPNPLTAQMSMRAGAPASRASTPVSSRGGAPLPMQGTSAAPPPSLVPPNPPVLAAGMSPLAAGSGAGSAVAMAMAARPPLPAAPRPGAAGPSGANIRPSPAGPQRTASSRPPLPATRSAITAEPAHVHANAHTGPSVISTAAKGVLPAPAPLVLDGVLSSQPIRRLASSDPGHTHARVLSGGGGQAATEIPNTNRSTWGSDAGTTDGGAEAAAAAAPQCDGSSGGGVVRILVPSSEPTPGYLPPEDAHPSAQHLVPPAPHNSFAGGHPAGQSTSRPTDLTLLSILGRLRTPTILAAAHGAAASMGGGAEKAGQAASGDGSSGEAAMEPRTTGAAAHKEEQVVRGPRNKRYTIGAPKRAATASSAPRRGQDFAPTLLTQEEHDRRADTVPSAALPTGAASSTVQGWRDILGHAAVPIAPPPLQLLGTVVLPAHRQQLSRDPGSPIHDLESGEGETGSGEDEAEDPADAATPPAMVLPHNAFLAFLSQQCASAGSHINGGYAREGTPAYSSRGDSTTAASSRYGGNEESEEESGKEGGDADGCDSVAVEDQAAGTTAVAGVTTSNALGSSPVASLLSPSLPLHMTDHCTTDAWSTLPSAEPPSPASNYYLALTPRGCATAVSSACAPTERLVCAQGHASPQLSCSTSSVLFASMAAPTWPQGSPAASQHLVAGLMPSAALLPGIQVPSATQMQSQHCCASGSLAVTLAAPISSHAGSAPSAWAAPADLAGASEVHEPLCHAAVEQAPAVAPPAASSSASDVAAVLESTVPALAAVPCATVALMAAAASSNGSGSPAAIVECIWRAEAEVEEAEMAAAEVSMRDMRAQRDSDTPLDAHLAHYGTVPLMAASMADVLPDEFDSSGNCTGTPHDAVELSLLHPVPHGELQDAADDIDAVQENPSRHPQCRTGLNGRGCFISLSEVAGSVLLSTGMRASVRASVASGGARRWGISAAAAAAVAAAAGRYDDGDDGSPTSSMESDSGKAAATSFVEEEDAGGEETGTAAPPGILLSYSTTALGAGHFETSTTGSMGAAATAVYGADMALGGAEPARPSDNRTAISLQQLGGSAERCAGDSITMSCGPKVAVPLPGPASDAAWAAGPPAAHLQSTWAAQRAAAEPVPAMATAAARGTAGDTSPAAVSSTGATVGVPRATNGAPAVASWPVSSPNLSQRKQLDLAASNSNNSSSSSNSNANKSQPTSFVLHNSAFPQDQAEGRASAAEGSHHPSSTSRGAFMSGLCASQGHSGGRCVELASGPECPGSVPLLNRAHILCPPSFDVTTGCGLLGGDPPCCSPARCSPGSRAPRADGSGGTLASPAACASDAPRLAQPSPRTREPATHISSPASCSSPGHWSAGAQGIARLEAAFPAADATAADASSVASMTADPAGAGDLAVPRPSAHYAGAGACEPSMGDPAGSGSVAHSTGACSPLTGGVDTPHHLTDSSVPNHDGHGPSGLADSYPKAISPAAYPSSPTVGTSAADGPGAASHASEAEMTGLDVLDKQMLPLPPAQLLLPAGPRAPSSLHSSYDAGGRHGGGPVSGSAHAAAAGTFSAAGAAEPLAPGAAPAAELPPSGYQGMPAAVPAACWPSALALGSLPASLQQDTDTKWHAASDRQCRHDDPQQGPLLAGLTETAAATSASQPPAASLLAASAAQPLLAGPPASGAVAAIAVSPAAFAATAAQEAMLLVPSPLMPSTSGKGLQPAAAEAPAAAMGLMNEEACATNPNAAVRGAGLDPSAAASAAMPGTDPAQRPGVRLNSSGFETAACQLPPLSTSQHCQHREPLCLASASPAFMAVVRPRSLTGLATTPSAWGVEEPAAATALRHEQLQQQQLDPRSCLAPMDSVLDQGTLVTHIVGGISIKYRSPPITQPPELSMLSNTSPAIPGSTTPVLPQRAAAAITSGAVQTHPAAALGFGPQAVVQPSAALSPHSELPVPVPAICTMLTPQAAPLQQNTSPTSTQADISEPLSAASLLASPSRYCQAPAEAGSPNQPLEGTRHCGTMAPSTRFAASMACSSSFASDGYGYGGGYGAMSIAAPRWRDNPLTAIASCDGSYASSADGSGKDMTSSNSFVQGEAPGPTSASCNASANVPDLISTARPPSPPVTEATASDTASARMGGHTAASSRAAGGVGGGAGGGYGAASLQGLRYREDDDEEDDYDDVLEEQEEEGAEEFLDDEEADVGRMDGDEDEFLESQEGEDTEHKQEVGSMEEDEAGCGVSDSRSAELLDSGATSGSPVAMLAATAVLATPSHCNLPPASLWQEGATPPQDLADHCGDQQWRRRPLTPPMGQAVFAGALQSAGNTVWAALWGSKPPPTVPAGAPPSAPRPLAQGSTEAQFDVDLMSRSESG